MATNARKTSTESDVLVDGALRGARLVTDILRGLDCVDPKTAAAVRIFILELIANGVDAWAPLHAEGEPS